MNALQYGPVLVGLNAIGAAFRRSRWTIRRWIDTEDFPAACLPNGEWTTTMSLIDEWILARARKTGSREGSGNSCHLPRNNRMTITAHEEQR